MKTRTLQSFVAVSALLAASAVADDARITTYKSQLRAMRVTQLPTETARLVAAEKPEARIAAAADAVTAAVSLNGASAPLVVASVAKSSPQAAATAAATAVSLQPKVASAITKAAVSAAPSEIDSIVSALCKARPASFYVFGVSAAGAAPKSADQILPAITSAIPALQPKLASAITKAAVSAAPSEVDSIVSALCKARPASFYVFGVSAAEAAPKSADQILPAITSAIPALKPLVQRAQADFSKTQRTASLAMLLKHTENLLTALSNGLNESPESILANGLDSTAATKLASLAVLPPVQNPPFVSGGGPPGEIQAPTGTTETAPTGRKYSGP